MSQTEQLLDAIVERLKTAMGRDLMVELFPENPAQYRLNHPRGAVLVAFGKSTFGGSQATDAMFQERNLVISLTLVFRQLNGKDGAVSYLDSIRGTLTGWWPPHCDQACRPVSERFIGHLQGVWQYGLDIATRATQLQSMAPTAGAPLLPPTFEGTL
ncbi:Gp37 family protein [Pseudomonas sp. TMP9]|uniref:Gp37 family protein n=1 Tax=Pseudomonas sp. TMP9 TaxID=3133144 RepID=UPI0030D253CA